MDPSNLPPNITDIGGWAMLAVAVVVILWLVFKRPASTNETVVLTIPQRVEYDLRRIAHMPHNTTPREFAIKPKAAPVYTLIPGQIVNGSHIMIGVEIQAEHVAAVRAYLAKVSIGGEPIVWSKCGLSTAYQVRVRLMA